MRLIRTFSLWGIVCVVGGIVLLNLFVRIASYPYRYTELTAVPKSETVIILGAGIKANGELSPVLQDRVEKAIELYEAGYVTKILISGNNEAIVYPSDDEVTPVRLFLLNAGVAAQDIFTDHEGYDTYTSMYRAKYQFGVSSLIISTQQFHLSRAVFIARSLGIDAYGISADDGTYQDKNYIREFFAQPKAVWDIVRGRSITDIKT